MITLKNVPFPGCEEQPGWLFRQRVLEAAGENQCCDICGIEQPLEIHHIWPRAIFNHEGGGVILCKNCHYIVSEANKTVVDLDFFSKLKNAAGELLNKMADYPLDRLYNNICLIKNFYDSFEHDYTVSLQRVKATTLKEFFTEKQLNNMKFEYSKVYVKTKNDIRSRT